ncbi:MAG: mannosyltransferase family protein [Pyrinomonadaceae bacterium]
MSVERPASAIETADAPLLSSPSEGDENNVRPLVGVLRRAAHDVSFRAAFFTFMLTRVLVLAVLLVGGQVDRVMTGSRDTTRDINLSLRKLPVSRILNETIMTADVNWYHGISADGYEKITFVADRPHNWAFFPLFPVLWRLCVSLTGEFVITGVLMSHLFFFFGLVLAHRVALAFGFSTRVADRSIFYLAIFPTSYFFSLPLTEPLFLLLTAGCLYTAKRGRWWTMGALGALASATRVTGVLIWPALAVLYWQTYGGDNWRSVAAWRAAIGRKEVLGLCIVPAGIASYMCYLYAITGNALAFKDINVTWGRSTGFFVFTLYEYLRDPLLIAIPWDFRTLNFAGACLALAGGALLLKWRQWALGAYTLLAVMVALSSLILQSQARYAMVLFPAFIALAVMTDERPRLDAAIRVVSLALLSLMTALFAAHFSVALS